MSDEVIAALIGGGATILAAVITAVIVKWPLSDRPKPPPPIRNGSMNRNVLLMLSSDQPPPPQEEIRWHVARCRAHGSTHLVTTRVLTGLMPGESIVAFYGNADLDNRYLGHGVYMDYVQLDTSQGQQILVTSSLYAEHDIPEGARGFIQLRDVQEAQAGETLETLDGVITSGGDSNELPLSLDNIPQGPARLQVYYRRIVAETQP